MIRPCRRKLLSWGVKDRAGMSLRNKIIAITAFAIAMAFLETAGFLLIFR